MAIHNTTGLVLRNIKYGETSLISTLYTKLFGLQAYLIQGARSGKKSGIKANYFQIGQFIDITAYHKSGKNLQRLKEVNISPSHANINQSIVQKSVAQYCTELVLRCVKEEEENEGLFNFLEKAFTQLDHCSGTALANFPIRFTLSFAQQIGFELDNNYQEDLAYFSSKEGAFVSHPETDIYCADKDNSLLLHLFLKEKEEIKTNSTARKDLLEILIAFLRLHLEQMQEIKSLAILHDILSD